MVGLLQRRVSDSNDIQLPRTEKYEGLLEIDAVERSIHVAKAFMKRLLELVTVVNKLIPEFSAFIAWMLRCK